MSYILAFLIAVCTYGAMSSVKKILDRCWNMHDELVLPLALLLIFSTAFGMLGMLWVFAGECNG